MSQPDASIASVCHFQMHQNLSLENRGQRPHNRSKIVRTAQVFRVDLEQGQQNLVRANGTVYRSIIHKRQKVKANMKMEYKTRCGGARF